MKIGVTGHQTLGTAETVAWIIQALETAINEHKPDTGITSLAIGADQLYTELLRKRHIKYITVIPCKKYEETFKTQNDLAKYQDLLQTASSIEVLPFDSPSEEAFFAAGKQMAKLSDIVIAIWDGLPAKGFGGTGDIVKYALSIGKSVLHINPKVRQCSLLT
jgi:hypothetical protein